MEKFILISGSDGPDQTDIPSSHVVVRNVTSITVRVTDDGHRLNPGEQAYVQKNSKALERAVSRGNVAVLDGGIKSEQAEKKQKKKADPKDKASAGDTAARADSETSEVAQQEQPADPAPQTAPEHNETTEKND